VTAPVLAVQDLTIALPAGADRAHAVTGVSFTVNPGEIVCLVGESGSGKTVIAHATMGLLPPNLRATGGQILLTGENLLAATETRLQALRCARMSMVFQEPMTALNPVMRCGDQIDEVLATHTALSPADRRAKVLAIVRAVQLPDPARMIASYPHQLSGGQRQRVALARALATEPSVLLLDEPFGALDARVRKDLRRWLRTLHDELDITSLFVTHDQDEALEVADRVVVLNRGRIEQVGVADELTRCPASPFVSEFLGDARRARPVDCVQCGRHMAEAGTALAAD
jgi:peptide/nickel transport system ATP-binding protein